MLGNCVITNKKGSANNISDVAIPNEFKFNEKYLNIKKIDNKIKLIFDNYEKEYSKFDSYKTKILNEKKIFKAEVEKLFQ